MKSKHISVLSAAAVSILTAVVVLGGLASLSSANSGGPTVVLSSTSASSTNAATIPITATFSQAVGAFASSSITATNATVGTVSGSGTTYTFNLTPLAQGAVTVMIADNAASSTASSTGNQMSNTLTFTYNTTAPVLAQVTGIASTTNSSSPSYTFSSTKSGMMNITGTGCSASSTSAVSGNNTFAFNPMPNGTYACSLSVTDTFGNMSNVLPINFTINTTSGTTTPPVTGISNIMVTTVGTHGATITWTTSATSTAQVFYGTSSAYGSMSALSSTATTSHSVTLTGLSEATLYHFQISSVAGTTTTMSSDMTFDTGSTASTTPLLVTGIDSIKTSAIADGTFANGWEWILHLTVPTVENNFAMKFGDFTNNANASSTIAAMNNIRIWSPQSSNASTTASTMTESGNGYSADIMLSGDTASTTAGRQIDVYIQAAVPAGTAIGTYSTTFGAMSTTTPF